MNKLSLKNVSDFDELKKKTEDGEISFFGKIVVSQIEKNQLKIGELTKKEIDEVLFSLSKRISRLGVKELFIDMDNTKSVTNERILYWVYSLKRIGINNINIIDGDVCRLEISRKNISGWDKFILKLNDLKHEEISDLNKIIERKNSSSKLGIQINLFDIFNNFKEFDSIVELLEKYQHTYLIININGKITDKEKVNSLPRIVEAASSKVKDIFISFGSLNNFNQKCINNMIKCKTNKYILDFSNVMFLNNAELSNYSKSKPVIKSYVNVKRILSQKQINKNRSPKI